MTPKPHHPSINSSPSAPKAPSKTPSTKGTSSSSIDYTPKSPTSSTSSSTNGYLNSPTSPPPRVPPPPLTQENTSMDITLTLSPIIPLDVQFELHHPIHLSLVISFIGTFLREFVDIVKRTLEFGAREVEYGEEKRPHLLRGQEIPSVGVLIENLDDTWEIHVTCGSLGEEKTRLRTSTPLSFKELCIQSLETASQASSDRR
ncbi:hypothetical protein Tco_1376500 [Tanacetum coccineum]